MYFYFIVHVLLFRRPNLFFNLNGFFYSSTLSPCEGAELHFDFIKWFILRYKCNMKLNFALIQYIMCFDNCNSDEKSVIFYKMSVNDELIFYYIFNLNLFMIWLYNRSTSFKFPIAVLLIPAYVFCFSIYMIECIFTYFMLR